MKFIKSPFKIALLLMLSPFFMAGFCSKDDALAAVIESNEQYFTINILPITLDNLDYPLIMNLFNQQ